MKNVLKIGLSVTLLCVRKKELTLKAINNQILFDFKVPALVLQRRLV